VRKHTEPISTPFEKRRTAEDQARRVAGRDAGRFAVGTGDGMDAGVDATQDAVARCAVGDPP
jgi:hypothetical protein